MAITTTDQLVAALATGQNIPFGKILVTGAANTFFSALAVNGTPGPGSLSIGNTTTGLVPTATLAGAPSINAFTGTNVGYLAGMGFSGTAAMQVILYDRLFHVGGVSVASLATTTLESQPSFAGRLPGTNYGLVEAWLEIASTISAAAVTVAIAYTNESGDAGRTATLDAAITSYAAGRMVPLRLQSGDKGIQKLESITIGGVAGTGSVNVVLMRRLASFNVVASGISEPRQDAFRLGMPIVYSDSCLALMCFCVSASGQQLLGDITIVQG